MICQSCKSQWDGGEPICPFCGSGNTIQETLRPSGYINIGPERFTDEQYDVVHDALMGALDRAGEQAGPAPDCKSDGCCVTTDSGVRLPARPKTIHDGQGREHIRAAVDAGHVNPTEDAPPEMDTELVKLVEDIHEVYTTPAIRARLTMLKRRLAAIRCQVEDALNAVHETLQEIKPVTPDDFVIKWDDSEEGE